MRFHATVSINGEDQDFVVDADNDVDAQNMVLAEVYRSIVFKDCFPLEGEVEYLIPDEELNDESS